MKSCAFKLIVGIVLKGPAELYMDVSIETSMNYMMNCRVRNKEKELLVYLLEA